MPKPIKGNSRYIAGLDGLRALAVLSVIGYHLNSNWLPGGLLGVGIFFVLSGYLITDLLIAEWKEKGRLNWKDFWLRRARRLLPAMLLMLVAVSAWMTLFDQGQLPRLRQDALAAVLYISNWWYIFHQVSYFESFGPPSPLGHFWSLAVEEQFYLIWPLLLSLGLRFTPKRGQLAGMALAGAAASALAMALIYQPGVDPSRVYYGTDTRAFALLIGAVLAIAWPSRRFSADGSRKADWALDVLGGAGLAGIALMVWRTNQYDDFLYRGGLVLLSVATAAVLAALVHPSSRLGRLLGWKPLRWVGVRSYGIYLWHYPVIVLTSPAPGAGEESITRVIVQLVLTFLLAALSWKFVEDPIRRGGLRALWSKASVRKWRPGMMSASRWAVSVCSLFILCVSGVGMAGGVFGITENSTTHASGGYLASPFPPSKGIDGIWPNHDQGIQEPRDTQHGQGAGEETSRGLKETEQDRQGMGQPDSTAAPQGTDPGSTQPQQEQENDTAGHSGSVSGGESAGEDAPVSSQAGRGITAIGDSVLLDVEPYLKERFPGMVVDAKVGRQMSQAEDVVDELKAKGDLGSTVIIELGTNGAFEKGALESLLQSLGDVRIFLVNTRVPRPWEKVVNKSQAELAKAMPNVTLVDWYSASAGKKSYFAPDGVHLEPEGAQVYAALVEKAVDPQGKMSLASSASGETTKW